MVSVLLSLFAICACVHAKSIPAIYAHGTSYEIGYSIGSTFKDKFQAFTQAYTALDELLIPFYQTASGREIVDTFERTNSVQYPELFAEMQGVANGSSVEYYKILLLNFREELFLIMQNSTPAVLTTPSCSDILVHRDGHSFFGHNEDNSISIAGGAFFQHITPTSPGQAAYTAYTYPCLLAGNAFSTNEYGLAISVNALFPKDIVVGGLGRQFLTRDVLNARDIDDAIRRITQVGPCASGFSINIGSTVTGELVNIEMAPGTGNFSVLHVANYSYHFNQYLRLQVPNFGDNSSDHRLARVQELPEPVDMQGVRDILGDTADKEYPIYRNGDAPDTDAYTLATALFDLNANFMDVYVLENPKTADAPLLRLPITVRRP